MSQIDRDMNERWQKTSAYLTMDVKQLSDSYDDEDDSKDSDYENSKRGIKSPKSSKHSKKIRSPQSNQEPDNDGPVVRKKKQKA